MMMYTNMRYQKSMFLNFQIMKVHIHIVAKQESNDKGKNNINT